MKTILFLMFLALPLYSQMEEPPKNAYDIQRSWDIYYGKSVTVTISTMKDMEDTTSIPGFSVYNARTVDKRGGFAGDIEVAVPVDMLNRFSNHSRTVTGILRAPKDRGNAYIEIQESKKRIRRRKR